MARSHRRYLTDKRSNRFMKNYANRKIRKMSVYDQLFNYNWYRKMFDSYSISDDATFGYDQYWSQFDDLSRVFQTIIYKINRQNVVTDYNNNMGFRHLRNK